MAGDETRGAFDRLKRRLGDAANLLRVKTTRVKTARGGRRNRTGRIDIAHRQRLALSADSRLGNCSHQRLRIGVQRLAPKRAPVRQFDDLAEIHDGDAIRDMLDHGQIMRDKEIADVELSPQAGEQIDDLGAN